MENNDKIEPGKLFVGGLSWETNEDGLKKYFSAFGEVADTTVMKDPAGRPRGFGFVKFVNPSSCQQVLGTKTHLLDNKNIDPKQATAKGVTPPSTEGSKVGDVNRTKKVFVGGIPSMATKEDMKNAFSVFGNVVDVDLKYDKHTNRMRGFGFVEFDTEEAAETACRRHHIVVKDKQVEIKTAQPRDATPSFQAMNQGGGYYHGAGMAAGPQFNYTAWNSGSREFYPNYGAYNQQHGQQQQYAAQPTGGGYGYGGAYNHTGSGTYQQYPPGYNFSGRYTGATPQQQQLGSYSQESTSYPAAASSYTSSDGYTNTGYGYNETGAFQHYPDQAPSATGYSRAGVPQPRAAGAAGYNSFGGTH